MPGVLKPVAILLDKERHLKLTLNAMVKFEEVTGKSLLKGDLTREMSAKELRAMLWCCLIHEDPSLTLERTGDLIDSGNLAEIADKIADAWGAAIPPAEGGQSPPP